MLILVCCLSLSLSDSDVHPGQFYQNSDVGKVLTVISDEQHGKVGRGKGDFPTM